MKPPSSLGDAGAAAATCCLNLSPSMLRCPDDRASDSDCTAHNARPVAVVECSKVERSKGTDSSRRCRTPTGMVLNRW